MRDRDIAVVPTNVRRLVHYRGSVQGVGFRYTVCRLAAGLKITGYVQNLADGRVRLVAEGESREVDQLLDRVAERMGHYIVEVESSPGDATGEFADFGVRY